MPSRERFKTLYPGVYYIKGLSVSTRREERIYYIMYRIDGRLIEEKAGRQFQDDMTAAKASRIRASRIEGGELPNKERREQTTLKASEKHNRWTLNKLFDDFIKHKAHLKSLRADKSRYNNHIRALYGEKEPSELYRFDFDRLPHIAYKRSQSSNSQAGIGIATTYYQLRRE